MVLLSLIVELLSSRSRRYAAHPTVSRLSSEPPGAARRMSGRQYVFGVALADRVHLRQRDREAVALVRVLGEEVLVVLLRIPPVAEFQNRRHHAAVPDLGCPIARR